MNRSSWKGLILAFAVAAAVTGCSQSSQPASGSDTSGETEVDAAQAKATYRSNCMGCHGENLEGAQGPSLEKVGAKYSAKKIEAIIQGGKGAMPAQVSLNPEERKNLAGWLADKK
ncbi:cytochrome c551 [Melghirimyces profundicolus]|uniref:Cytochrome c551 n=1 Tax=Melghirimyces profundicolus TaxID=1242148 RepID=A0A2T6C4P3_9BACL|nr:cytochrome c [Melghirimyces profundicolus]PTX63291.1 cytochrome c551 [Melghirimyces profundicolus]